MNNSIRFEPRKTPIINSKVIGFTIAFGIVGTLFLLTGCGGGGGGPSYPTPSLPADAVVFDGNNSTEFANRALSDSGYVGTSAKQEQVQYSVKAALDMVADQMYSTQQSAPIATGATETITIECLDISVPGSSGNIVFTVSGSGSSGTGSISFNNCSFDGIITVDGIISFDGTADNAGNFNFNGGGTITITDATDPLDVTSVTMVMNFNESGNDFDGTFASSFSFSISGLPGSGYLAQTTQPLVGDFTGVWDGEITVYGGSGTSIRIDITGLNTANVYLNEGSGEVYHDTIFF